MKYKALLFLSFATALLAGCSGSDCTDNSEPGFVITVYDKQSMEPVCGAKVILIDGEYIETKRSLTSQDCTVNDARLYMAFERRGDYQVTVSKEGYQVWASDEVAVLAGDCHVIRNHVDVFLEIL